MARRPKVSICIPSYNHARYLPAAIESALNQTFKDLEVVIVDDGSKDDSLQIAESYASRYPSQVRVLTHPGRRNMGIGETANLAFREARGEYWSGLPSDDVYNPDKIEAQVAFLEKNPNTAWVYSYSEVMTEAGERLPVPELFGTDITGYRDPLESLIQKNPIPAMTVLARRDSMEKSGPEDGALLYSDWERWVRLLANTRVAFIARPLVLYRVHGHNTSIGIEPVLDVRHSLEVMRALKRKSPSVGGDLIRPRTQALLDLQLSYYLFGVGDEAEAKLNLTNAFESDPALRMDSGYMADWLRERMYDTHRAFPTGARERGFASWVLSNLPGVVDRSFKRRVAAVDFARLAFESHKTDAGLTRRMALKCFVQDPRWVRQKYMVSIFLESLIGSGVTDRLRRLKRRASGGSVLEPVDRKR